MRSNTLFYRPGACALAPHIVLQWVGADHEAHHAERDDPDLLTINPSGAVPAFVTSDGRSLTQAAAILQHIALSSERGDLLCDADPILRDEVAVWLSFFTGDFHPAFWPFFAPFMYIAGGSDECYPAIRQASFQLIRHGLAKINAHLEGRDKFVGQNKTVVDAYSVPMLRWAKDIEGVRFSDFPHAAAYYENIVKDGGVLAAMQVQGIEP